MQRMLGTQKCLNYSRIREDRVSKKLFDLVDKFLNSNLEIKYMNLSQKEYFIECFSGFEG